jgi:hypothetical protein
VSSIAAAAFERNSRSRHPNGLLVDSTCGGRPDYISRPPSCCRLIALCAALPLNQACVCNYESERFRPQRLRWEFSARPRALWRVDGRPALLPS